MWKVEYTKRFLKDLSELPKEIQIQVEGIVFEDLLTVNPFSSGYIERMKGYPNKYKIRIGDYRIGITIDKQNTLIICQRIAHVKTYIGYFHKLHITNYSCEWLKPPQNSIVRSRADSRLGTNPLKTDGPIAAAVAQLPVV